MSSLRDYGFFNSDMGSGRAQSGGSSSTGALVSRVSSRCIGANRSRTGYTCKRIFDEKGRYFPYALQVCMKQGENYNEAIARWRYERFTHDKKQKESKMASPLSSVGPPLSSPTFADVVKRSIANDGGASSTDVSALPAVVPVAGGGGTSSYAENAAVLLASPSKHPDQIAQANEVMHPPPPIPPDRN
jgi:hypothetical protein